MTGWWRSLFGRKSGDRAAGASRPHRAARGAGGSSRAGAGRERELEASEPDFPPAPTPLEITDVLDLHTFAPREVPDLVRDWLDAAYERGFREVRIIHGRGVGVQRRTVRTILERDPRVIRFEDAPGTAGGWGATVATLE